MPLPDCGSIITDFLYVVFDSRCQNANKVFVLASESYIIVESPFPVLGHERTKDRTEDGLIKTGDKKEDSCRGYGNASKGSSSEQDNLCSKSEASIAPTSREKDLKHLKILSRKNVPKSEETTTYMETVVRAIATVDS